ncbi:MAG: 30S ribosomal protein S9 [Candidatus Curtissbacteria bacterium]|nr:30S ribosomal protein S9 [Candidatus Curtissbacteria bacterium]
MNDELKTTEVASPPITTNKKTPGYISVHGRRKEATASIRLFTGKGETLVNDTPAEKYFTSAVAKSMWQKPFRLTKTNDTFYATIRVVGSGKASQIDAIILGLSRALSAASPEYRAILKKAHLLTRDPRVKERRKYGNAQKARKGKQSPKR